MPVGFNLGLTGSSTPVVNGKVHNLQTRLGRPIEQLEITERVKITQGFFDLHNGVVVAASKHLGSAQRVLDSLAQQPGKSDPKERVAQEVHKFHSLLVLGIEKPASDIYHLGGSLIVVCATVAMGEVFRTVRYLNIPLGVLVAFGPPLVGSPGQVSLIAGAVLGLAAAALAWRLGPITENYGSWDRFVK